MPDKKYDLPAMPFYIGDWKKDPAVQVLSREDKMIWLELIFLMWESEERGYLTINKKPMTSEMIATALNLDNQTATKRLTSFADIGLFSKRESDGAIFCRKIVKIIELSNKRKNAGKQGGNPNLVNQRLSSSLEIGKPIPESETENEVVIKIEYYLGIYNQFLPPELQSDWCAYLDYCYERKDIRLNKSSITQQVKFLREHLKDAKKIMRESIKNNWKGLFEIKEGNNGNGKPTGAQPDELAAIVARRFSRENGGQQT